MVPIDGISTGGEVRAPLLFDMTPIPLWVFDLESLRFRAVNEAMVRAYGWSRKECLGMTIEAIRDPAEMPALRRRIAEVPECSFRAGVWRHRARDGREILADITAHRMSYEGRDCMLIAAQDVTEHRKAEEQLLTLSRAVEQSPAAIVITDTAGTILFVNPQFCRSTGFAREEAIGKNPRILKSGLHPPEFYAGLWRTISAGQEWRGELQNRRKDGTLYWEAATISPVTDPDGRVTHFVAVKEDVTSRKVLEEQLRQSQKMEAVGRLAGGVAHDFNNLLTVIGGFSELAMGRMDPEDPCRALLEEVRKAADRAAGLTRQLLAFSRRQVLQPVVLDLNGSVAGMERMLRRLLGEDVSIDLRLDPSLHRVLADAGQVEQAVMNLCVNARDAMPTGGRIRLSTRNLEVVSGTPEATAGANPGPHACLEVEDTGTGMAPDVLAHIFEPFFTTKPQGKGTGLGLPMVYGFVRQSGGALVVDSSPGNGSTFRILLPLAPEEAGTGAGAGPRRVPESLRGTETILVVEDEPAVASVASRSLGEAGYEVLTAGGPDEAMRLCADHRGEISLLVTDVVMPGLDGKEVAALVQGMRPGIRVLFMSGYTDDVIGQHGILDPGIAFLSKPFHPAGLCAKVREVLDAKRPAR
jgi:PAS domain S-box-containing protein